MFVITPVRKKSRFDIAPASQDDNINSYQVCINHILDYSRSTRVLLPIDFKELIQNMIKILEKDQESQYISIEELYIIILPA